MADLYRTPSVLDEFSLYTTHFELYVCADHSKFKEIADRGPSQKSTTRYSPDEEGLLLNTRTDFHQVLDNLEIEYSGVYANPRALLTPSTMFKFNVYEPGGIYFIDKLKKAMTQQSVTTMSSFGLAIKIFIFGRTHDNEEKVIKVGSYMLFLADFQAHIDVTGATYTLTCNTNVSMAINPMIGNNTAGQISFIPYNMNIKAATVGEAIQQLQLNLNKSYENFKQQSVDSSARPCRFLFELDPELDKKISGLNKDSTQAGEAARFTFEQNISIYEVLQRILMASPEINERIDSENRNAFSRPFFDARFLPIVTSKFIPLPGRVDVIYTIKPMAKSTHDKQKFTFNFFFAGAGQNVDVMGFDLTFNISGPVMAGLNTSKAVEVYRNQNGQSVNTDANTVTKTIITENKRNDTAVNDVPDRKPINAAKNDIIPNQPKSNREANGNPEDSVENIKPLRHALLVITEVATSNGQQLKLDIRGRPEILQLTNGFEVNQDFSLSDGFLTDFIWIKVNMFDSEGEQLGYRGYYRLVSMRNSFSGGKFTQELYVSQMQGVGRTFYDWGSAWRVGDVKIADPDPKQTPKREEPTLTPIPDSQGFLADLKAGRQRGR